MDRSDTTTGSARYVFRVRFRLEPTMTAVSVDPATFETKLYREAEPPGQAGWLFFRDHCWRGEVGDEAYMRSVAEDALGVSVESISFRELQTDRAYLEALRAAIGNELDTFNAETVDEALGKYFGSSIHVRAREEG